VLIELVGRDEVLILNYIDISSREGNNIIVIFLIKNMIMNYLYMI